MHRLIYCVFFVMQKDNNDHKNKNDFSVQQKYLQELQQQKNQLEKYVGPGRG